MIELVYDLSVALIALAALTAAVRAVKGPSVFDRVLAVETVALGIIGLLLLQGNAPDRQFYIDAALGLALVSFIGATFLGFFLGEGELGE